MNQEQLKPSELKPWVGQYPAAFLPDINKASGSLNDGLWLNNLENMYSTALCYGSRKISFKEMKDQIICTARALVKIGVQPGDVISVCAPAIPESLYLIYAMDLIGAVSDILDPGMTEECLHTHFLEVKSKVIVALDSAYAGIQKAAAGTLAGKIIIVSRKDSMRGVKKMMYRWHHKDHNQYEANTVMWLDFYYSGMDPLGVLNITGYDANSTGMLFRSEPKDAAVYTVMLTTQAVNAVALQYGADHFAGRERILCMNRLDSVFGFVCGIHAPLCYGASVIIPLNPDEDDTGMVLMAEKPDHLNGCAAYFTALCESANVRNADLSFLKSAVCSDGMAIESEQKVNGFLKSHECGCMLTKVLSIPEMASAVTLKKGFSDQSGDLGYPLCDTTAGIFDLDSGAERDFNEIGEICFTGLGLMKGYFGMPEATSEILRQHEDGKIWLHSGMIGRIDRDGCLLPAEEDPDCITLYDGQMVNVVDIEHRLEKHSNVLQCVIVGVSDSKHQKGELPFAFIKWKDESVDSRKKSLREIRRYCQTRLPESHRPVEIVSVRRLPQTADGLIDYNELVKQGNMMYKRR